MTLLRKEEKHPCYSPFVLFFGIALSIIVSSLSIPRPAFIGFLDNRVYDALLESTSTGEASDVAVIVDVDEKSLKQYGQWPWPRYRIALLLDKLRQMGALSVGLDMLFAENDRTSIHAIRKELLHDFGVKLEFNGLPQRLIDSDRRLADALSEGSVVLGYQFLFEEDMGSDECLLHPLNVNLLSSSDIANKAAPFIDAPKASCNLKLLSEAAVASGFFNVSPDRDGILRRVPLVIEHRQELYPSLALATLIQALDVNQVLLRTDHSGAKSLRVKTKDIPLSPGGNMLLRFRGKSKTFEYISAADILSDRITEREIQGRIVFIGTSAAGMNEFMSTPLDPVFPGVEVHATVVDNILTDDFLHQPKWVPGLDFLIVLASGVLSTLLLSRTGAGWSSLLLGIGAAGIWLMSDFAFRSKGIFISPVLPLMAFIGNFFLLTLVKFWREERTARERSHELALAQEATIESMSSLTEARDPETGWHIRRTQNYIRILAEHLKNQPRFRAILDDESIDLLCKSAPLHDIGKVGVSDRILLKPGKLTEKEFDEMKKHTIYGHATILSTEKKLGNTSFLGFAREIAYTHHEKWDGSGYPQGLKGEEIPLSGRLMALADTYDALISKRVYKDQFPHEKAVQIITQEKGAHFDPELVDAFLRVEEQIRQIALEYADSEEERATLAHTRNQ